MENPLNSTIISKQLKDKEISVELVLAQIKSFQNGPRSTKLLRACTINDGIKTFNKEEIEGFNQLFSDFAHQKKIVKFVPASGASSRMFESLLLDPSTSCEQFLQGINRFAFLDDLKKALIKDNLQLEELIAKSGNKTIVEYLLTPIGLNYANLPKGLIKFHHYPSGARTPVEEHLIEAQTYALDKNMFAHIHFTISSEHKQIFKKHVSEIAANHAKLNFKYSINFSTQTTSSDTVSVDLNNQPIIDNSGHLVFRPGGHGALLCNLNDIDADIIFIKNIDNIVTDRLKNEIYTYKKLLGGYLIKIQNTIFKYLEKLNTSTINDQELQEILKFSEDVLSIKLPLNITEKKAKIFFFISKLNRPLRVCGMVKNQGEPGGGPFWTVDQNNETSLQIVEKAEIDQNSHEQQSIWQSATHFSPVDIVLSKRCCQGGNFKLVNYIDQNRFYISTKSKDGKNIKALEHPGLWNGAMAYWNTIFVEVPIATFNPVKTVFDLLRTEHQP